MTTPRRRSLTRFSDPVMLEPIERTANKALVERAIDELRQLVVGSQMETILRVGDYLIEQFYGGYSEARSRKPRKAASLRQLSLRAGEFGMSGNGVRLAVAIALQARELGKSISLRLTSSQHRALLPIASLAEKRVLAEAAIEAKWSYEKLRARVVRIQKPHAGGRPGEPAARVLVRRLEPLLEGAARDALANEPARLSPEEARSLAPIATRLVAELTRLAHALERRGGESE